MGSNGFRRTRHHDLPALVAALWAEINGDPPAECCLVNLYRDGARMGLHQDRDEADFRFPVLSVSLGDTAIFRIGGTRRDWRGQGHFRALTEESEVWAHASGFEEVVVKTKNRYYDMRAVLAQLQFNVVKHEPHPTDTAEAKVYLSKLLAADLGHRSVRNVVHAGA